MHEPFGEGSDDLAFRTHNGKEIGAVGVELLHRVTNILCRLENDLLHLRKRADRGIGIDARFEGSGGLDNSEIGPRLIRQHDMCS